MAGRDAGPDFDGGRGCVEIADDVAEEVAALWNISKLKLAVMLGLVAAACSAGGEVIRGATPGVLEKLANSGMVEDEEEKVPKSSSFSGG